MDTDTCGPLIHSSLWILNFMSTGCTPKFSQVSGTTLKFQQAWLKTSSLLSSVANVTRGISVSVRDVNRYQK